MTANLCTKPITALLIATVLTATAIPAAADVSYGEELNGMRQACLNKGGSWTGNSCRSAGNKSQTTKTSGGGWLWPLVAVVALGAASVCAASDCLDQEKGE